MRAELLERAVVRALAEQVQVEIGQHAAVAIRIVALHRYAARELRDDAIIELRRRRDCGSGWAIGVERPQEKREQCRPHSTNEQRYCPSECSGPSRLGRADAADKDHLHEESSGGERRAQYRDVTPQEAECHGDGERPVEISAHDTTEKEPGGTSE